MFRAYVARSGYLMNFLMKQESILALCTTVSMIVINLLMSICLAHKIKKDFHEELTYVPAVEKRASLEKARDSYADSAAWDVESVLRLTAMLRQNQKPETVDQHLEIGTGRRFMNYADSLKAFPSLSQGNANNLYYDTDVPQDNEQIHQWKPTLNTDNSVVVITNPSEARLPADTFSVKSLKETMEARAKAARYTPSTTKHNNGILVLFVSTCLGVNVERGGWLDRVVQYHKNQLFDELKHLPPVKVKASIVRAPVGYRDAAGWDVTAVLRLLAALRRGVALPVLRYLRRAMPSRRFMKFADTFLAFPSLALDHPNDFYYDVDSNELNPEEHPWGPGEITDESIIVVSNPTEARLPSAQISVKLLKEILEARAIAARYIPTTKKVIMWKPMPTKSTTADTGTVPDAGGSGTGGGQGTTVTAVT